MKDIRLGDLIPEGWELKEIKSLTAYDKEGHKLWEIHDEENNEENIKMKIKEE